MMAKGSATHHPIGVVTASMDVAAAMVLPLAGSVSSIRNCFFVPSMSCLHLTTTAFLLWEQRGAAEAY